jgi:hypothetical protein
MRRGHGNGTEVRRPQADPVAARVLGCVQRLVGSRVEIVRDVDVHHLIGDDTQTDR